MQRSVMVSMGGALFLAACATPGTDVSDNGFIAELPEAVAAIAAPYQDLSAVRLDPATGCYIYRYAGPVETTMLPLVTREGRPICTRAPDDAA